jgi:hypothetical protein
MCSVGLPVHLAEPAERLHETVKRCEELKVSPERAVLLAINKLGTKLLPPSVVAQTSFGVMDKHSVLLSNVAGPPQRIALLGRPVASIAFFATSLVSTCFDVISYDGTLQLSVLADPAVLPRGAAPLLRAFEDELDALVQAARAPRKPLPFDSLPWRRLIGLLAVVGTFAAAVHYNR